MRTQTPAEWAAYMRNFWATHPASRERQHARQRTKSAVRRSALVQLLGGACACGSTDRLEFDHIDPETKAANVSDLLSTATDRSSPEERGTMTKPLGQEESE